MKKVFSIGTTSSNGPRRPRFWLSPQLSPKIETNDMKQSSIRIGEECISERYNFYRN